jgi:phosphocarrier protein NPr
MLTKTVTICNKLGLHARASAKLVATASRFASQIEIRKGEQAVNGKSIMGVMMLAASKGSELDIAVEGEDAQAHLEAVVNLINNRFDEDE